MDRGAGASSAVLRKRALSIDTASAAAAAAAAIGFESKAAAGGGREEESLSPTGRLFLEPHFRCHIVSVFGLGAPVDLPALRAGVAATLARHPRFCSVQVSDEFGKDAWPKWVRTAVNLDNHIIVPELDPAATSADPDKALEDYVSSLSTRPMDHSIPLWELHVLDFPTAEAAAALALRVHHSVGDGVSMLSLFMACTRSAADPDRLPALPPARRAGGPLHAVRRPRPLSSAAGALDALAAMAVWVMSFLVLAWNTVVDVLCFFATATSLLRDAPTVLKGQEGTEFRPKRFVNRTLSLDDVKFVKNAMSCTVNDVLLGITSAALSRYYFRKTGESDSKSFTVRSAVLVNLRPTPGIQTLASMMESGKNNGARWGNKIGYMLIPFHLAKHDDPIEYVRKATKVARRKKNSMESVFTFWSGYMVLKLVGIKAAAALCYGMITHTTLSFSNMVGPTEQVLFCGNPVVYIAPGTYGHPHALTIHYQSYMSTVKLVLSVDESHFPDCHQLLDDFAESLRLIREAASQKSEEAQDGTPS
ncbi:O-acyltransferase WSD1 [Dichanthelium oligosanthes]|uniref:O-acyltransferase WSD1 n=1 Tax=Dichanthelium oligosanthes TaxID=888268 RepID=A0A1E5V0Q9_9POAL|nr:O-acyltransferase WSD1 [Dichanthelium oligosanthes]